MAPYIIDDPNSIGSDLVKPEEYMLTTLDNPYNPFTQWDEWFRFDTRNGYNTCAYLARVTASSIELSAPDESIAIDLAMNEILEFNVTGMYLKVTRESWKDMSDKVSIPTVKD